LITIEISHSFYCAIVDATTNKKTLLELQIVFNETQMVLWDLEALGFVIPTPVYQLTVFTILISLIGMQKHSTFSFQIAVIGRILIKQLVVTKCSKERPDSIVTKTLKNGILIPIITSK